MGSNLGQSSCVWCGGRLVAEGKRLLFDYKRDAHCEDCLAQYVGYLRGEEIYDCAFRSTERDEPGLSDFPKYGIRRGVIEKIPWCEEMAKRSDYRFYWEYHMKRLRRRCSGTTPDQCAGLPLGPACSPPGQR